jgi:hypothetical protein
MVRRSAGPFEVGKDRSPSMLSREASLLVVIVPWLVVLAVFGEDVVRLADALLNYIFG